MSAFPFRVNWAIAYLAGWFWMLETLYFGFNWEPNSAAEVVCDGIVFLLVAMALAFAPPNKPRVIMRRIFKPGRQLHGVMLVYRGDVEILSGEDLQA